MFEFPGPDEVRCGLCQRIIKASAVVNVKQRTSVAFEGQVLGMSTLPVKACGSCARTNGTVVPVGQLVPQPEPSQPPRIHARILQFRRKV